MSALSIRLAVAALMFAAAARPAAASPSRDACAGRFVDTLPAVITSPGTWCLRRDLSTPIASGSAVTIDASDVTLDCNGHRISGLAAGRDSLAVGIELTPGEEPDLRDAIVRDCHVRGFFEGMALYGGALVEDNRLEGNLNGGIYLSAAGIVRRNLVVDTGGTDLAFAGGIGVRGTVDVIDNTVDGVVAGVFDSGYSRIYGVRVLGNSTGGTVRGNRIRGIDGVGIVHGIEVGDVSWNDRVLIAANQVSLVAGGDGIRCQEGISPLSGLSRDNVVHGATIAMGGCYDLGGNEVVP